MRARERLIALHEGYEELKEKIPTEKERIKEVKNKISKINADIERAKKMMQICRDILGDKLKPHHHVLSWDGEAYYEIRAEFDGKDQCFGRGDTEEEATIDGKRTVEKGLPTVQKYLEEYKADKNGIRNS